MATGAVCLKKSHDIVILSFCDIVKGQAIYSFQKMGMTFLGNVLKNSSGDKDCIYTTPTASVQNTTQCEKSFIQSPFIHC